VSGGIVSALTSGSRRSPVLSVCLLSWVCLCLVVGCGGGSSSRHHTVRTSATASATAASTTSATASATAASTTSATGHATAVRPLRWRPFVRVRGVVDLSSPLPGTAAIRVAAHGRLETLSGRRLRPFGPAYAAPPGLENYLTLSSGQRVAGAGCRFPRDALYALRLTDGHGVTVIDQGGRVRRFAALHGKGLEDGITFDLIGRFEHRLLVTTYAKGAGTTVAAIDCRGHVTVLTHDAPRVEGGIAVAPASFGRYAGDLIASDELTGNIYAISPTGQASLVGNSGLAHGQDIGTESEGFVPARYANALVSDRGTPHNRHPGDNEILALPQRSLHAAGVAAGDLLVVNEGGAGTIAVTCRSACQIRPIATGPAAAHIEGHVVFSPRADVAPTR
jgi:hypothetical protein